MPSLETPSAKKRRARECVPRERAGRCATPTRVPKPSSPSTGNRDTAAALHTWRIWARRCDRCRRRYLCANRLRVYHCPSARLPHEHAACPSPSPAPPSSPPARARPPAPPPRRAFRARPRAARPRVRFSARRICGARPRCARRRTTRPPRPRPRPRSCPSPSSATTKRLRARKSPPSSRVRPERERTAATDASRSLSLSGRRGARPRHRRDAPADAPSRDRDILTRPRPSRAFPSNSTGVVSVALAVGYLALVQVIDSREMLPPPPEAMGMGECPPGERRC